MAYSSGFNPHPRISYAGAAPTGAASEAEYLEIALAEVTDAEQVRRALEEALPDGLDVLDVVDSYTSGSGSLADRLEASRWRMQVALPVEDVAAAVAAFLAVASVPVERMTKRGLRTLDCRAPVVELDVRPHDTGSELELTLRHTVPAVRPDDVLSGLTALTGLAPPVPALLTRMKQGPLDPLTGEVGDPLR